VCYHIPLTAQEKQALRIFSARQGKPIAHILRFLIVAAVSEDIPTNPSNDQ
jgi:hypothetical protein